MSANKISIKSLRDNFIKRHSMDPDFFVQSTQMNAEDHHFQDKFMSLQPHPKAKQVNFSNKFTRTSSQHYHHRPTHSDIHFEIRTRVFTPI